MTLIFSYNLFDDHSDDIRSFFNMTIGLYQFTFVNYQDNGFACDLNEKKSNSEKISNNY